MIASTFSPANAEADKQYVVSDLSYGVSLYNFFQDKYFSAITDLLIAKERQPIQSQGSDPDLLLGGLYLTYGLHQDASTIFHQLVDQHTTPIIRDRAWFNLAKLQYKRGAHADSEKSLHRIQDTLPDYRNSERLHLLANIHMQHQQYDEAISTLESFSGNTTWEAYAQFNLGVTLVKKERSDEGLELLRKLGHIEPVTEEQAALRDKANLALGFSLMRLDRSAEASDAFKRVRLESPQSDIALLGIGWAWNRQSLYEKALVPWMELKSRDPLSPAVQESLLAIPYTFEQLERPRLALSHYDSATTIFSQQLDKLEQIITGIKNGELLKALTPGTLGDENAYSLFRAELPDSISAPYLKNMMASHQFQEAVRNYQDLLYLDYVLQHWERSLPTFTLMLDERRRLYEQKSPKLAQNAQLKMIERYQQQRNKLAEEFERIIRSNDIPALANEDEREYLEILSAVKNRLNHLSNTQDLSEQQEKYRLINGILYWQISEESASRQWQLKKGLKELDAALEKARRADNSLQNTWSSAPGNFKGFANRITGKKEHIDRLRKRVTHLEQEQKRYINALALSEIGRYKVRLEKYQARARFALARLYDTLEKAATP